MNDMIRRHVQWVSCLYLLTVPLVSANLIQDDFSGVSIDTGLWGATNTSGASVPAQVDGKLTTLVTVTGQNNRALLYSVRTDLNFFAQPITLSANIATLGGTGSVLYPVNRYLMIGSFGTNTEVVSRFYPGTELRFGAWLLAGETNGVNYLEVGTVRIGNVTAARQVYSGVLTNMSLVLNRTAYSVTASGSGGFSVGSGNSFTGTLANVFSNEFNSIFRFAMGAANSYQGAVTAGASAEWESISVIPEPAFLSLVLVLGGGMIVWRNKRKVRANTGR